MSSISSRSSTPQTVFYKLPPIITTESDREFLNEVNTFVDAELKKINNSDEEQRYIVYKSVFNKVIEHVSAYKPLLTNIKKEYEDTIETIKKGRREAAFLQGKLKAMASEPSTLRNYKKRADELEERIVHVKKDNGKLEQEIKSLQLAKEEKEKRPKSAEVQERQLKKDSRLIPGLSIEESTDMKILQRKYETLDRQLKELNLSLRARFLPKSHKLQLKDSLDKKVAYRDQLLWQSQVYKMRGSRLKIALEAAQAYNQMKPPHQTVGDAVTLAFQQASGMLKAEREKVEGEQNETSQTTTFEDDDPNKEKEAEMMLEYIEKFNELFEDGLYEEAAVHAANSPKGILRTQATLAKFRDVKVKHKGRSPLLAFCDAIMSSVKAAGSRPNEALSNDCMYAALVENRLDLAYHWLSQDRLTQSLALGQMITDHCSCPVPCLCGCQALAQGVFTRLKSHQDMVFTLLKQGKIHGALQTARLHRCIDEKNVATLIKKNPQQEVVNAVMETDNTGKKLGLDINFGCLLLTLVELERVDLASGLIQAMLKPNTSQDCASQGHGMASLQMAVTLDSSTPPDQWMVVIESLGHAGHHDSMVQLLAMTTVVDIVQKACQTASVKEERKGVSFSVEPDVRRWRDESSDERDEEEDEEQEEEEEEENGYDEEGNRQVRENEENCGSECVDDDENNDIEEERVERELGDGEEEGTEVGQNDKIPGQEALPLETNEGIGANGTADSSFAMSSRSRDSTSVDHSSRETSPETTKQKKQGKESIIKKRIQFAEPMPDAASSSESSPRKPQKKKALRKRVQIQRPDVDNDGIECGHKMAGDDDNDDGVDVNDFGNGNDKIAHDEDEKPADVNVKPDNTDNDTLEKEVIEVNGTEGVKTEKQEDGKSTGDGDKGSDENKNVDSNDVGELDDEEDEGKRRDGILEMDTKIGEGDV